MLILIFENKIKFEVLILENEIKFHQYNMDQFRDINQKKNKFDKIRKFNIFMVNAKEEIKEKFDQNIDNEVLVFID